MPLLRINKFTMKIISIVVLLTIPQLTKQQQQTLTCTRGTYCPTDISNITNNGQVAYYSFWKGNRLADETGISGPLVDTSNTAKYTTDGPWSNGQAFYGDTTTYFSAPGLSNIQYYAFQNGLSICVWFTFYIASFNVNYIYYFGGSEFPFITLFSMGSSGGIMFRTYTATQNLEYTMGQASQINTWYHTCSIINNNKVQHYWNGVFKTEYDITSQAFSPITSTRAYIGLYGYGGTGSPYMGGLDEFRVFKRALSATEVTQIYNFRAYPCPAGTANDLLNQRACAPCPPNTYQPYPGQSVCLSCSSAGSIYYGSTSCVAANACNLGPLPWKGGSVTPGTATYTVGANSVSMNCPSGTYSTGVSTMTPITSSCFISDYTTGANPCPGTGCCIWVSSEYSSGFLVSYAFDGLLNNRYASGSVANNWVGFRFGQSTYVDSVLLFDDPTYCSCSNTVKVYVGDFLVNNPSSQYTTPSSTVTGYSYFTSSPTNTLCYTGSTTDQGYRNPLWVSCKTSGLYLYIVTTPACQTLAEIVVLSQPPCTLCPPGTYSHYNTANTQCTNCPVGTFSNISGASACTTCPTGTFQPLSGQSWCRANIPAGSHSQFGDLLAYYPFFNGSSVDVTGRSNNMEVYQYTATIVPFQSSTTVKAIQCQGGGVGFAYAVKGAPVGQLITRPGLTICGWVSISANANNNYIWGLHVPGKFITTLMQLSAASSTLVLQNEGYGDYSAIYTFTLNTWFHMCMAVVDGIAYEFTVNGAYVKTKFLGYGNTVDAWEILFGAMAGSLADIKIFSRYLSQAEAAFVTANPFSIPCPLGSFQDLPNQDTCKPCGIGFASTIIGATVCTTCASATWYGTSTCSAGTCTANVQPTIYQTRTPGQAMIYNSAGPYYTTFNCPSGTYCPSVFQIQSLATSCSFSILTSATTCSTCTAGSCCGWASTQYAYDPLYIVSNAFLGRLGTGYMVATAGVTTNEFVALYFPSSTYIDTVIIIDRDLSCSRENNLKIYIGDTLEGGSGAKNPQVAATWNGYPVATTANKLCYSGIAADQGYRSSMQVKCKMSGQYLYIVGTGIMNIVQIIVTNTSICTPCSPGTYSYNTIPTVRCSQCPSGTYQSGVGKSYCDSCATGTYQSGVGMTSADNCVGVNSGLIAYYTFTPGARLKDSTGSTGDLTYPNTVSPQYSNDGQWKGASAAVFSGSIYLNLPSMNIGATAIATGMSFCMWYSFASTTTWTRLFSFGDGTQRLLLCRDGSINLYVYLFSAQGGTNWYLPNPLVLNQWRHICITVQSRTWTTYDNGLQVRVSTVGWDLPDTLYTSSWLGKAQTGDPNYVGSIDEFRIYNRALSAAEVLNVYNFRNFQANATAFCRAGDYCPLRSELTNDNLIAYYSFWSDQPLLDATGVTGPLTVTGTPTYSANGPWTGSRAVTFSGTQYYQLPSFNLYQYSATTGFSVCLWFTFSDVVVSGACIFDLANGQDVDNLILYRSSTTSTLVLYYRINTTPAWITIPQAIVNNQWRHVCIVNKGRSWTIYDNGQPVFFHTASVDLNNVLLTASYIAKSSWNVINKGNVDEFRIYNIALTADQVLDVYNFRNWPCPAGSYCPTGTDTPIPCPQTGYSAATGASACTLCPVNTYALSAGMTSSAMCVGCS